MKFSSILRGAFVAPFLFVAANANTQCYGTPYYCNSGYQTIIPPGQSAYNWACGSNCAGGPYYTDFYCRCACVPNESCAAAAAASSESEEPSVASSDAPSLEPSSVPSAGPSDVASSMPSDSVAPSLEPSLVPSGTTKSEKNVWRCNRLANGADPDTLKSCKKTKAPKSSAPSEVPVPVNSILT